MSLKVPITPPSSPPRWWTTSPSGGRPASRRRYWPGSRRICPAGSRPRDADFGPPSWDRTFSLPPVPGVLNARDLVVEVTGAGNGQTAIRVDAQVSWQPPRPASERVPSAARVVTITQLPSLGPHARRPPAPVTITDLAVVRRLAALVDSLQLSTIGPAAPCPASLGGGIRLTFLARAGGPPLAVAQGPGRLRHRAVQRRRQAAARAPDHRLVHPAGPQARRPALEGPVGIRGQAPVTRNGRRGPPRTARAPGAASARKIPAPIRIIPAAMTS